MNFGVSAPLKLLFITEEYKATFFFVAATHEKTNKSKDTGKLVAHSLFGLEMCSIFKYDNVASLKGGKHQRENVSEVAVKKNKGIVPWHILYSYHCDVFLHSLKKAVIVSKRK